MCMRKKKKKAGPARAELAFLKRRRAAVQAATDAASKESKEATPGWMKALSSRLWSGSQQREVAFNKKKLQAKQVVAFKAGHYAPRSCREKRALEGASREHESKQKKARHDWEKSIAKRTFTCFIAATPPMHH